MGGCLLACAPQAVREAEDVVAQADSLWHEGKQYGIDEGDSATLAQAYETLKKHSAFSCQFSDSYAHTCYHYGKLLRTKENPVEAMQAFIAATHSGTKDYHILGRVYNNMGDICHLASEFQLSYDMFEQSANMYLKNGDSLLYYYCLNDMAFEKAMLSDEESTYTLIGILEECEIIDFRLKILELESELYLRSQRYDSARQKALELLKSDANNTLGILVLAQSYSFSHQKDSAAYYAEMLLQKSQNISDIHNALYILTNDDESKSKESIRKVAADRSDIQMRLKDRQGKLSQAVQLLEQDLHRKPDYRWLYTIIGVILFAGSCAILYYLWHKRKVHSRLIHDIDIKQEQKTQLESSIVAMHSEISQLSEQQQKTHQQLLSNIETTCSTLRNSKDILSELNWKDYPQMCKIVNHHFNKLATTLQKMNLSEQEVRLCILVVIGGVLDKQMADILYYSHKSIRSTKRHIALKLGTTSANMRAFLMEKIIE